MKTTISYLVEDHPHAQRWLWDALEQAFPGISVEVAADCAQGHALLDKQNPDIALIDLNLPDGNGIELIARIRTESPKTVVVVTTIYDDDEHLFPALEAGAKGYILKEQKTEEIARLLQGILRGEPPLSPVIAQRLISYFSKDKTKQGDKALLTEREREVLAIIATGKSLSEAAKLLGVTRNTVASQVKSIYSKLNISSRAEAAIAAARMGLLEEGP